MSSIDATYSNDPRPARRSAVAFRAGLAALAVATVLTIPQLTGPAPVAAGSSCTGWTSKSVPPRTIRVLRTHSGRVETVGFRRYVAEVMASGDYAMRGHHRPSYERGGRCYDVRDDTMDQLYRPENANPNVRQEHAIDATWPLTLRKFGRFFLTGYRAGTVGQCAADANGWTLYTRSVEACARQGWSGERVLKAYFGPNVGLVWSTQMGPILEVPALELKRGSRLPDSPVTVSWRPARVSPGVARYTLQRRVGKGAWQGIKLASPTATRARVWLKTGVDNRFRIRGTDGKGRTGSWVYSNPRTAALRGPVGVQLGGASLETTAVPPPTWARSRFSGRSVAVVAAMGPGMGKAKIFVNGRRVAIVDLQREAASQRELVWAMNFGRVKPRTVAVRAADPARAIEFQGFYVLR